MTAISVMMPITMTDTVTTALVPSSSFSSCKRVNNGTRLLLSTPPSSNS